MSGNYTHRLCIAAPLVLLDLANAIGRALDPDVGGDKSFDSVQAGPDAATPTHAVCDVIVVTDFATQAAGMLGHPAYLHGAVAADYAARWPHLVPPSLAECEAFIAASAIAIEPVGRELAELLATLPSGALVLCPAPHQAAPPTADTPDTQG